MPRRHGALLAQRCAKLESLRGTEFLRKLRRFAHDNRIGFRYEPSMGKGSHGRVWLGSRSTTIKDPNKELGPGLLAAMCRDLAVHPRDL